MPCQDYVLTVEMISFSGLTALAFEQADSLVRGDEVSCLFVSKFHIISQHVDVEKLPHILLPVIVYTLQPKLAHNSC